MCELLRFGLIRELRLSTQMHFDLHGIFLEPEVGIRSIGDLQFSDCRIYVWKGCLVRVFVVKRSCVQRPTFHVHEQHWRYMGQCEERHFYQQTCTNGSDTACQHVDDTVFTTCSFFIICHVHAVRRRCIPTDRSFFFFCNGLDCHPTRVIHKKRPMFDHRLCFFHVVATKKL